MTKYEVLTLVTNGCVLPVNTVEPLTMDTLKSGQPPYNGQTVHPLPIYCPYISTSEEGTTSEQWTKHSSPIIQRFHYTIRLNTYVQLTIKANKQARN